MGRRTAVAIPELTSQRAIVTGATNGIGFSGGLATRRGRNEAKGRAARTFCAQKQIDHEIRPEVERPISANPVGKRIGRIPPRLCGYVVP